MKFVLMCQVLDSGDSAVNIKWLKDNQEVGPDLSVGQALLKAHELAELSQVELVANEELGALSLVFRKIQQQHSGNYTCLASNRFGSSTFSSFMSVKGEFKVQTRRLGFYLKPILGKWSLKATTRVVR